MTMDFDLLIRPNAKNADKLIACLAESGFGHIPQSKKEANRLKDQLDIECR